MTSTTFIRPCGYYRRSCSRMIDIGTKNASPHTGRKQIGTDDTAAAPPSPWQALTAWTSSRGSPVHHTILSTDAASPAKASQLNYQRLNGSSSFLRKRKKKRSILYAAICSPEAE
ncbi:hypothetical protein CCUS01_06138 [Colletotrichum cuscutae]|uniref:Uncharacterized protein n=1 Tax=Colletotrichum cuscutae TaxID=1209917 RepID=A0AAI9V8L7_9PEZI|nr:hypothetical protein CCUS01_06138 [Colletotrichum cuscutae]